jgi:hypothetical protein
MGFTSSEVRKFLLDSFSDEEIESFCFDHFPEAQHEFSTGMPQGEKVSRLLEHVQRRGLIRYLFVALQKERPDQSYALFGSAIPDNVDQLFMAVEPTQDPGRTLSTYTTYTEQMERLHARHVRSSLTIAIPVVGFGLLVAVISQLSLGYPILQNNRMALSIAGFFVSSLSVIQFVEVVQHKQKVDLCENARLVLTNIRQAYQSGDVSGGTQLEQLLQQLMGKIAIG